MKSRPCSSCTVLGEGKEPGVLDQQRGNKVVSGSRQGTPKLQRTRAVNIRADEVYGRNSNIWDNKQQGLKV